MPVIGIISLVVLF